MSLLDRKIFQRHQDVNNLKEETFMSDCIKCFDISEKYLYFKWRIYSKWFVDVIGMISVNHLIIWCKSFTWSRLKKVGEHMNCQDQPQTEEEFKTVRNYYSLNIWTGNWILISQRFSRLWWVIMIWFYYFEWTTYCLFSELTQYLLNSFISFGKHSFSKLCLKTS